VAPFLAAVAAFALTAGGFLSAFLAFLLFAGVMAALMMFIAVLAGTSQEVLLKRLRASSQVFQRVGGTVLMLAGLGLIYFTLNVGAFRALFYPFLSR